MHRLLLAALGVWIATLTPALAGTYTEPFTTTTYRDAASTTADWDVTAGSIHLPAVGITPLGGFSMAGAKHVLRMGNTAVVDRGSAVDLIDCSVPSAPVVVGTIPYSGSPAPFVSDIARFGSTLYISWRKVISVFPPITQYGVDVYSVANPAAPAFIQTIAALRADAMTVRGTRLYVANGASLLVWDITDAIFPASIGSLSLAGTTKDVAVAGNTAYVATNSSGMHVVDVTSATTPSLLATISPGGSFTQLDVQGTLVCASAGAAGVHLIDVSSAASPLLVATITGAGAVNGAVIDGDNLAVATDAGDVSLWDITSPAAPRQIASKTLGGPARDVRFAGTLLLAVDDTGFGVYQGAVAWPPSWVRSSAVGATPVTHIVAEGDYLFMADGVLRVFDNKRMSPLAQLGQFGSAAIQQFDVDGSVVYAVDASGWFYVLDVSNPAAITVTGSLSTGLGGVASLVADGDQVVLVQGGSTGSSGLYTINVVNPATPGISGFMNILGGVTDVAVSGSTAYVFNPSVGVQIYSIATPASISLLGTYGMGPTFDGTLAAEGALLYVAGGRGANQLFEVVDASIPGSPAKIGGTGLVTDDLATVGKMAVQGNRVLVAGGQELHILDVTDPTAPAEAHRYVPAAFHNSYSVGVSGDFAYFGLRYDPFGTPDDRVEEVRIFDRGVNTSLDVAQSLSFAAPAQPVAALRMIPSQTGAIAWEYSPDDGVNFYPRAADGSWENGPGAATGLRWRATLQATPGGPDPQCTNLAVEWRYDAPAISTIADVPGDEGGQVDVSFLSSGYDLAGSPPATLYALFRRSATGWDSVAAVAAAGQDNYVARVPTLVDSTLWDGIQVSAFFVRVWTAAGTHFDSPVDSGYSVDNTAPQRPSNLVATYNSTFGGNRLTWTVSPSADVTFYRVHRDVTPAFTPTFANAVDSVAGNEWVDPVYNGWNVYYVIEAVDSAGNASGPTKPEVTTDVPGARVPARWALEQNIPNPFNPATTIAFDVPAGGGNVRVAVFDVTGRRIATLFDGRVAPGVRRVQWNGRDDAGVRVSSGVYFARLSTPAGDFTRKMTLVE